jgi:transposase-like protein
MAKQQRDSGRERFWRQTLRQWRRGKLNVRDFCSQHGLSEPSFYSWRRELARRDQEAATHKARGAFVPVAIQVEDPSSKPTASAIEVIVGQRQVRVWPGFDEPTLARVLAVLEGRSC